MRQSLGTAVFSGMIGVALFGIFLTPVFFFVLMWFSRHKQRGEVLVPKPAASMADVSGKSTVPTQQVLQPTGSLRGAGDGASGNARTPVRQEGRDGAK